MKFRKMRTPYCDKNGLKKGTWTAEEDLKLFDYVTRNGHDNWRKLPKRAGLQRCGKSCRLRWMNYLRPGIKRGNFTHEEQETIIKLHARLGNKWSMIASHLHGRSDNEIKNHWHAYLKRRTQHDSVTLANEQPEASTPNHHHSLIESIQEPDYVVEMASSPIQNSSLATTPDASPSSQHTSMDDFFCMLPEPAPATDANFVIDGFPYVMEEHTDHRGAFYLNDLDEIPYFPGEFFAPFVSETESLYPGYDVWGLLEERSYN